MGHRLLGVAMPLALFVAASCASEAPARDEAAPAAPPVVEAPNPIPAGALPGRPSKVVELDAAGLAADSIDTASLETLLIDAGFVAGTERRFSKTADGRRRVTARVLAFETAQGAERYLAWLAGHVAEIIGDAEAIQDPRTPAGGVVFVHEPTGCCHLETRLFLGAWRHDATVLTLKVGGQSIRLGAVLGFVSMLDAAV